MRFPNAFPAHALAAALAAGLLLAPCAAHATDVDGPDDCQRVINDFGDAPEGIAAYPGPVIGNFPTCVTPGGVGTQTFPPGCPPISTPPGPTGFVRHVQFGPGQPIPNFWLGCYGNAIGPFGIDSEPDGKTNTPAIGISACTTIPTDCVEAAYGMTFDQDECLGDGSDAGLTAPPVFMSCAPATVKFDAFACISTQAFLNVLVDWNEDGDWNDAFDCGPPGCAYEWAVKNVPIGVSTGCNPTISPPFLAGPNPGQGWMRLSITLDPVPDDFPWNGSAGTPTEAFVGGESEDYPAVIVAPTPTSSPTWGRMKVLYR